MYCSLFVDQSVVLNRRRDGPVGELTIEELEEEKREEELAAFYIQVRVKSKISDGMQPEKDWDASRFTECVKI